MTTDTHPTRSKILEAALDAFANRGYDGASTHYIASCAGVQQSLIGYHFGSKEQLWKAAIKLVFERMSEALQGALDEAKRSNREDLPAVVLEAYVRACAAQPQLVRLMLSEATNRSGRLAWIVENHLAPLTNTFFTSMVTHPFAAARLPQAPPPNLFYAIVGASTLIFTHLDEAKEQFGIDATHPFFVDAHVKLILEIFNLAD